MRILVPIDLWDPEHDPRGVLDRVLPWAIRLGGKIDLLCSRPPEIFPSWHELPHELVAALRAQWVAVDAGLADRLESALAEVPDAHRGRARVEHGDPWTELAAFGEGYDLAILTTHARTGIARVWAGSVTERFVARSGVPTLVMHAEHPRLAAEAPLRVLVGVDLNEASAVNLASAEGWAARLGIHVIDALFVQPGQPTSPGWEPTVHAIRMAEDWVELGTLYQQRLEAEMAAAVVPASRGQAVVRTGAQAHEILEAAQEHDLLIVGSHHRVGLSHLWHGSISERVVRRAPCPVLVM